MPDQAPADRLREAVHSTTKYLAYLRHNPARALVPVVAACAAAILLWRVFAPAPPGVPEATIPLAGSGASRSEPAPIATSAPPRVVAVHLAGAVARPGVHMLADGSRVIDAVNAAGGPLADADVARVNLAAKLIDGTRIYVPRVGELAPPGETGDGAAGPAGPVNLNQATADQLDALPGIGPATAAAIVNYRRDNGPFRSVDELVAIRGIGPARLEELRSLVTV